MNVTPKEVETWPRKCERLQSLMQETQCLLAEGKMEAALERVEHAYIAVMMLGTEMRQIGVRPNRLKAPADIPLSLLCSKANWQYAQTLRAAYEAGRAVDRERGWEDEGSAQILWMILADVEAQVFGVKATPSVREKKPSTGRRRTVREI